MMFQDNARPHAERWADGAHAVQRVGANRRSTSDDVVEIEIEPDLGILLRCKGARRLQHGESFWQP